MPETPFYTVEQIRATESLVCADIGAAQDEIIRRLTYHLPQMIADENTRKGWTGNAAIVPPTEVLIAPADITSGHINKVLVAVTPTVTGQGIGAFRTDAALTVTAVFEKIVAGQQVRKFWRYRDLILMILYRYLRGCVNEEDVSCWSELYPGTSTLDNNEQAGYSAITCEYRLTQGPNIN